MSEREIIKVFPVSAECEGGHKWVAVSDLKGNISKNTCPYCGLEFEDVELDNGKDIGNNELHILEIRTGEKSESDNFSDEWLADYPGIVGTEKTDNKLKEMIRKLSEK